MAIELSITPIFKLILKPATMLCWYKIYIPLVTILLIMSYHRHTEKSCLLHVFINTVVTIKSTSCLFNSGKPIKSYTVTCIMTWIKKITEMRAWLHKIHPMFFLYSGQPWGVFFEGFGNNDQDKSRVYCIQTQTKSLLPIQVGYNSKKHSFNFNSLASGRCGSDFRSLIFKPISLI